MDAPQPDTISNLPAKCSMKSQHNLLVAFHERLVIPINLGHFQGYRASVAHKAQSLISDTGNGPRDHVFFFRLYCRTYIHVTTALGWDSIRLHRIITVRLILDGS